jgi:hypothetical protein
VEHTTGHGETQAGIWTFQGGKRRSAGVGLRLFGADVTIEFVIVSSEMIHVFRIVVGCDVEIRLGTKETIANFDKRREASWQFVATQRSLLWRA